MENRRRRKNEQWLQVEHNRSFGAWFRDQVLKQSKFPTRMKDITRFSSEGRRMVIQYNELGQPLGSNATKLKRFIATTVRFHIPITYSTWHVVPK